MSAITDVSDVLEKAISVNSIFDSDDLTATPVALFYDMDLLDAHMADCKKQFGPTFTHHIAIKSNSTSSMMQHAHKTHGFGIECASIGEILHAKDHCKIPSDKLVFDSPCKTTRELQWSLKERIHCNLDNFDELDRAKGFFEADSELNNQPGVVGLRINPLVGAGEIAELSVSTAESKFGVPITQRTHVLEVFQQHQWLSCIHVHVGSGGMGVKILVAGIRAVVDLAFAINTAVKNKQVTVIDIGGGIPANYQSDSWALEDTVPTFQQYATVLRDQVPELFTGEFKVISEFGQGLNAKSGWLASRIEWMKGTPTSPMCIIHFGASECVRQAYGGKAHARRIEGYRSDGSRFIDCENKFYGTELKSNSGRHQIGGPLCFQGDFVAKGVLLPDEIKCRDFIVMKDAGANTLSLFSRHCSRLCPPVWGYRRSAENVDLFEIKPRETMSDVSKFWGPTNTF